MAEVDDGGDEDSISRPLLHGTHSYQCDLFKVHDLPQLYQQPSASQLLEVLDALAIQPTNFAPAQVAVQPKVNPSGVPRYLTAIVASSLSWIMSSDDRESIYSAASARLAERAGRSALPSITRTFCINDQLVIELREPSLTGDSIGFKTWTSSLLLARRLPALQHLLPALANRTSHPPVRILELGAGTGLVGLAAAGTWEHVQVTVTDLPEIVSNLQGNVVRNSHAFDRNGGNVIAGPLDWADESACPLSEDDRYPLVMAADPLYSDEHPRLLVNTVDRWLAQRSDARFVVEVPLRSGYDKERHEMTQRLRDRDLQVVAQGEEVGWDDWEGRDGQPLEVRCSWSVWRRTFT